VRGELRFYLGAVAFVDDEESVLFGGFYLDMLLGVGAEHVSALFEDFLSVLAADLLGLCVPFLLEVRHLLLLSPIIKH
jgi:hypothetical protein